MKHKEDCGFYRLGARLVVFKAQVPSKGAVAALGQGNARPPDGRPPRETKENFSISYGDLLPVATVTKPTDCLIKR